MISISQKFYRAAILWWMDQKTSNFYQIFVLIAAFLKNCIIEFPVVFICLLLSWSGRYSMEWSSKFDGSWFQQYLTPIPPFFNMINLCPNIWFIKNSKCRPFLFWRKNYQKSTIFTFFKRPFIRNGGLYWYECRQVFRGFWGLSNRCSFAIFTKM